MEIVLNPPQFFSPIVTSKQMEKESENESIDLLVAKSKELLNYQLNCYDTYFNKAGIFISISSLFTPISFSLFETFNDNLWWTIAFFVPITLNLLGLFYLIKVAKPNILNFGIGYHKFDELLERQVNDLKLTEIGANRSSYIDNEPIILKQSTNLKKGLTLIIFSAFALTTIMLVKYLSNEIPI